MTRLLPLYSSSGEVYAVFAPYTFTVLSVSVLLLNFIVIDLTVPEGVQTVLYVPEGADVTVNSVAYYQNGGYVGNTESVEIVEIDNY